MIYLIDISYKVKMKYLYIWNDIPVFYNINTYEIESKIKNLFKYLNTHNKCKYVLISNSENRKWISSIGELQSSSVVTIGTRPRMFRLSNLTDVMNIRPKRIINDLSGVTNEVILDEKCKSVLDYCIQKNEEIHFIEDVIVGGRTITAICDYLGHRNYKGKIIFHVFSANKFTVQKLKKEYFDKVVLNIGYFMDEKPIEGSTLLCCSDLLYGKLGDKYYIERKELLKKFFFEDIDKFLEVVKWILGYVNNAKNSIAERSL